MKRVYYSMHSLITPFLSLFCLIPFSFSIYHIPPESSHCFE